jgi:hypothetical protein
MPWKTCCNQCFLTHRLQPVSTAALFESVDECGHDVSAVSASRRAIRHAAANARNGMIDNCVGWPRYDSLRL